MAEKENNDSSSPHSNAEIVHSNDFIEIDYTAKLAEDKTVFDTTINDIAEKHGLKSSSSDKQELKPAIICVGEGHVLKGLDKQLEGKEIGKEYTFYLSAENAFGKKDSKLIKMIPARVFLEQKVQPMPGLSVNIDGIMGVMRVVTSGRVIVDFNHPLAGKDVMYEVKILRKVGDVKEKTEALLRMLGLDKEEYELDMLDMEAAEQRIEQGAGQGIEQGAEQGLAQGLAQGLEQGSEQSKKAVITLKKTLQIPEQYIIESVKRVLGIEIAVKKADDPDTNKAVAIDTKKAGDSVSAADKKVIENQQESGLNE